MPDNNQPAAAAPTPGQVPANQPQAGNNAPASGDNNQTPSSNNQNPQNGGQKVEVDAKELERLKRDAGRWNAHDKRVREDRRTNRHSAPNSNVSEDGDPELVAAIKERDEKLSSLQVENLTYKVKDQVSDILENEDYKDVPDSLKRAIKRNPLAFADPRSRDVRDIVADIQDYMDDELDRIASRAPANNAGNNQPAPAPAGQPANATPPANGSGPSNPSGGDDFNVAGKTGQARSAAILGGLLKKAGIGK